MQSIFDDLIEELKVYEIYNDTGPINLLRIGKEFDGGYVVPETSLLESDVLMGYGIYNDISFEETYSDLYHKEAYGFDCGIKNIAISNPLTHFISECIGNNLFLNKEHEVASDLQKVTSFDEQIANLNLVNKKILIKMDIEGAEYDALTNIIPHSSFITGIVLEIHFSKAEVEKATKLLKSINNHFVLAHLHANNCCDAFVTSDKIEGAIPGVLELSYINKSLLTGFELSNNTNYPKEIDMRNVKHKKDHVFKINYQAFEVLL